MEFDNAVDSIFNVYMETEYLEYLTVNIYWDGDLPAGVNQISGVVEAFYETHVNRGAVFSPIITWEADSFEEWEFPDPTMGGILPEITNSDDFKSFFGIDGEGWEKTIRFGG